MDAFFDSFARAMDVLAFFTFLVSAYAAFRLWRLHRQYRELAKKTPPVRNFSERVRVHEGVKSSNPVALAISLKPNSESIKPTVEKFLGDEKMSMPVEEISIDGIDGPEDLESFVNALNARRSFIESAGFTEVHLFIAGPVQAGTLTGAIFSNWIPVKLYHMPREKPQLYEYWMPLLDH